MSERASILVVDDEPDMGIISQALGKRCGWTVEHRLNASTAWSFLQAQQPDLVLVDVRLPGTTGPELCRRLRSDERLAELKLALFTHGGVPEDVADGLAAGVPYLVNKELICQPDAWQERIREILAAPRGRGLARPVKCCAELLGFSVERLPVALPGVFRHSSLRGVALPVVRAVVQLTLRQAFGPAAGKMVALEEWLLGERLTTQSQRPLPELDPQSTALVATCLAEQLGCLLGESTRTSILAFLTASAPSQTKRL